MIRILLWGKTADAEIILLRKRSSFRAQIKLKLKKAVFRVAAQCTFYKLLVN